MKFGQTITALLITLIGVSAPLAALADMDLTVTGTETLSATTNVALLIPDLTITGTADDDVPVKLLVSSGSLALGVTSGLTFTGGQTGATLYFSGSLEDVNAALATLTYTRGSTGSDVLEVSVVEPGEVFFPETGHLYEYIADTSTWAQAKTRAELLTRYGATGYLTTIMSADENAFVAERLSNAGWMGASDSGTEGTWKWVTGPENDTTFWQGVANGSTVGGNYANWGTGEPNQSGEEDCGQFLAGGSGKWNDLPCSGTTLPGYVVEFGATGHMPTVAALDITITTSDEPAAASLSPADNATDVAPSADLVIEFTADVTADTGNIVIKKSSDDTIIETIDVTSGQVTGSGTDTITINPSVTLAESTEFYVLIDATAFEGSGGAHYDGIQSTTAWSFTTGDVTAPEITQIGATPSATGASITWTTNEAASSRVVFGAGTTYGSQTDIINTSPRVTEHSVSLTGLLSCATYHYRVVSSDAASQTATSTDQTFGTTGCTGDASAIATSSASVDPDDGGETTTTTDGRTLTVAAPAQFTATTSTVSIQIRTLPDTDVLATLGRPTARDQKVGTVVFDVKAIVDNVIELDSFDAPVTITYTYADADLVGLDESTLWLYHYHDDTWAALDACTVDTAANTIECTTESFSIFSLFGDEIRAEGNSSGTSLKGRVQNLLRGGNPGSVVALEERHEQWFATDLELQIAALTARIAVLMKEIESAKTAHAGTTRDLYIGDEGEDVSRLQAFLIERATGPMASELGRIGATGLFGEYTRAALAEFQAAAGILPSAGYFGPLTRAGIPDWEG